MPPSRKELAAAETERLAAATAAMDEAAREAAHETARQLREWQETPDAPEALATIPVLQRADLETQNREIDSEALEWEGARVLLHELPTNGIAYIDLAFDLRRLPAADCPGSPC